MGNFISGQSFHASVFGMFGTHIPTDLDGYAHLSKMAWLSAPMFDELTDEMAQELADQTCLAVAEAKRGVDDWRETDCDSRRSGEYL